MIRSCQGEGAMQRKGAWAIFIQQTREFKQERIIGKAAGPIMLAIRGVGGGGV